MKTSLVFHRPICIIVSGIIPFVTASVAPVGLNDLAEKPLFASPANSITSSKMFETVLLEMALYGLFNVKNNGLDSAGRSVAVLSMYVHRQETGTITTLSVFAGIFTS